MEELDREGVGLVQVGYVTVEAIGGVLVGEEADVGKFPAEDWRKVSSVGGNEEGVPGAGWES